MRWSLAFRLAGLDHTGRVYSLQGFWRRSLRSASTPRRAAARWEPCSFRFLWDSGWATASRTSSRPTLWATERLHRRARSMLTLGQTDIVITTLSGQVAGEVDSNELIGGREMLNGDGHADLIVESWQYSAAARTLAGRRLSRLRQGRIAARRRTNMPHTGRYVRIRRGRNGRRGRRRNRRPPDYIRLERSSRLSFRPRVPDQQRDREARSCEGVTSKSRRKAFVK